MKDLMKLTRPELIRELGKYHSHEHLVHMLTYTTAHLRMRLAYHLSPEHEKHDMRDIPRTIGHQGRELEIVIMGRGGIGGGPQPRRKGKSFLERLLETKTVNS